MKEIKTIVIYIIITFIVIKITIIIIVIIITIISSSSSQQCHHHHDHHKFIISSSLFLVLKCNSLRGFVPPSVHQSVNPSICGSIWHFSNKANSSKFKKIVTFCHYWPGVGLFKGAPVDPCILIPKFYRNFGIDCHAWNNHPMQIRL